MANNMCNVRQRFAQPLALRLGKHWPLHDKLGDVLQRYYFKNMAQPILLVERNFICVVDCCQIFVLNIRKVLYCDFL